VQLAVKANRYREKNIHIGNSVLFFVTKKKQRKSNIQAGAISKIFTEIF
jgi:hypothetical protein